MPVAVQLWRDPNGTQPCPTANRSRVPRIDELANGPRPTGCKKLTGHDNRYRIRVGDLRVVYQVDDQAEVLVLVINHRRDVYRDLRRLLS